MVVDHIIFLLCSCGIYSSIFFVKLRRARVIFVVEEIIEILIELQYMDTGDSLFTCLTLVSDARLGCILHHLRGLVNRHPYHESVLLKSNFDYFSILCATEITGFFP